MLLHRINCNTSPHTHTTKLSLEIWNITQYLICKFIFELLMSTSHMQGTGNTVLKVLFLPFSICGRRPLKYTSMTYTSWYSHLCIIISPWVWTRLIVSKEQNTTKVLGCHVWERVGYKKTVASPLGILSWFLLVCSLWRKSAIPSWGIPVERSKWWRTNICQQPCKTESICSPHSPLTCWVFRWPHGPRQELDLNLLRNLSHRYTAKPCQILDT